MIELVSDLKPMEISPYNKIHKDIVNFMPDMKNKMHAMFMLRRVNIMPIERQLPLMINRKNTKTSNIQYTRVHAAHNYISIVPGSQAQRLGISEFIQK